MICKTIPLNCGAPSFVFWALIQTSQAAGLTADYNSWTRMEKLRAHKQVYDRIWLRFFKKELKTCAARLGGPAREWPARYGF